MNKKILVIEENSILRRIIQEYRDKSIKIEVKDNNINVKELKKMFKKYN